MAPHSCHFLEQRTAFLGPQGQGLIDHPLADEQEGVVGEVSRIEQIHQILQPNALPVQQVIVLARPEQTSAELDRFVVDRQKSIGVAEDESDVGHAESRPLLGARKDDVFGLPKPKRTTLLPQRPTQGIGEVALARSVWSDDGADAGAELDQGSFPKGLEALKAQSQQTSGRSHRLLRHGRPSRAESRRAVGTVMIKTTHPDRPSALQSRPNRRWRRCQLHARSPMSRPPGPDRAPRDRS